MAAALLLLKDHWRLLVGVLAILVVVGWYESLQVEISHLKADNASQAIELERVRADGVAQKERIAQIDAANAAREAQLAAQLKSALAASDLLGSDLERRVRAYEAAHRACPLPQGPSAPAATGPPSAPATGTGSVDPGPIIARALKEAKLVATQYRACLDFAGVP